MKKILKKKESSFGLTPLGDRIILKETKTDAKKTDSGIYIPDTVKEDRGSKRGIVVAVGPGRLEEGDRIPVSVKKGDEVLYQWGDTIMYDGVEYVIVKEGEVIATIK